MAFEPGAERVAGPTNSAWSQEAGPDDDGAVLVATDDPDLQHDIARPLRHYGFAVVEAQSPAEALEIARARPVDVAVVDADQLEGDGAKFLHSWREALGSEIVPVVLVTHSAVLEDVSTGIQLGAHDYLLPPFEPVHVLARVHSALEAKRRHDDFRRRVSELQELARTDSLTGLYNRRHMEIELAALASAGRRQGTPLGILLIDVDRFKRINDRVSYEAGDTALRTVAQRIRAVVRAEDVVGRWGGDEFVVLLPCTDLEAALTLAQRLRRQIAEPVLIDAVGLTVTVSVGCAADYHPDEEALLRAADAALHRAKAGGRNRVSL